MPKRVTPIKWDQIRENDRIRVEGTHGDMDIRREGTVYRIVRSSVAWHFVTKGGYELLSVTRDKKTDPPTAHVWLLARNLDTALFDL